MEITFLGKTSFKFKTKNLTLLINPLSAKEKADVIVLTGEEGVAKEIAGPVSRERVFIIDREGEYELGGVGVIAERLEQGKEGMLVRINADGVEVAHTGAVTQPLTEKQAEKVREADVLLASLAKAAELIELAEPYIAVLMGYDNLVEVDDFLSKNKFDTVKRDLPKLKLEAEDLPETTEVVVLNA